MDSLTLTPTLKDRYGNEYELVIPGIANNGSMQVLTGVQARLVRRADDPTQQPPTTTNEESQQA